MSRFAFLALVLLLLAGVARANPPVASYVFPAGGQRGQVVPVRVGGLFLHRECGWEVLGPGVTTSKTLRSVPTRWFEGPRLPLPESQQAEDYPQDMAGEIRLAADCPTGTRRARLWTSEGVASGLNFVVGELPEVVEDEKDGAPVPVPVNLPVTVNGRIFPRENIDDWLVTARKGEVIRAEVLASRIGSPLDARLEVLGPDGRVLAENDDHFGADSLLFFTAPENATYRVRVQDAAHKGGQNYVYRLTLTRGPAVERVFPLGGRRGGKTSFTLAGYDTPGEPVAMNLPDTRGNTAEVRFNLPGGPSQPVKVALDDLPEFIREPGKAPGVLEPPAVLNGRISAAGAADEWQFRVRKGKPLHLQLRARDLSSPLQGVVEVLDAAGKPAGRAALNGKLEPELQISPPADGVWTVRVRDRFRSRGGPAFAYRLRVSDPVPDFQLLFSEDSVTVPRKGSGRLKLSLERRGGFAGPVAVRVEGLPDSVKVGSLTFNPGQTAAELIFQAGADAPVEQHRVRIRGTATLAGESVTRVASPGTGDAPVETVLVGVALPAPFKVVGTYDLRNTPRGGVFRKRYQVERNGYEGPLEVRLADRQARHLQGEQGPVLTVPAGATEFEYPVTLPPWMETGRTSRACVMATGVIEEKGVRHTVSYTSPAQNDQIIAVVETGRLGLELRKLSIVGVPGGSVKIPLEVRRARDLVGPVKVELILPEYVRGVSALPLTIPADDASGTLEIQFHSPAGPFNKPLVVRATLAEPAGLTVAEGALEVTPE